MRKIYLFLFLLFSGAYVVKAQGTCANAVAITSIPFNSGTLTTCGSGNDYPVGTLFNSLYGGGEDYVFSLAITNAPVSYNLALGGGATYKIASVHSACPPTSANAIGGVVTSSSTTGLATVAFPSNGTYYIIVDTWPSPACGEFTLSISTPPTAPPACATNITPANAATGVAYLPSIQLSWNAAATATSYDIYWSADNGATYTNLGNTPNTTVGITNTLPLTTYYWYVAPKNAIGTASGCQSNATRFTTGAVPAPPNNDSCGAPVALLFATAVAGTNVAGTQSLPPTTCEGAVGTAPVSDVWYRITALTNGNATVALTNASSSLDAVIHAYSGACGTLTNIGCADATAAGGSETLNLTNLVAGQTYLLRVYGYSGGAGTFTITASGPALPVTGLVLSGVRNGKNVQLHWQTLTEINNAGFEVQRSADGKYFTGIASIASKANSGNSTAALNYAMEDAKSFSGSNYYRLKQTDKDGKVSYSNVVYLKGLAVNSLTLSTVYPNPARDVLKASVQAPAAENITFIITDMTGKATSRQVTSVVSGDNTINLNVANLPSGNYLLKAVCSGGCESAYQKFSKQ